MKKTFLPILIMAACVAAGCSDDNKEPWEEIPDHPITGADAMLSFNGQRSYGTVTVDARNETSGSITLDNVIPGYPEVDMDVTLSMQPDGSFSLKGSQELDTPPCMIPDSRSDSRFHIYTLTAEGMVSTDGKATVDVTSTLTQAAQGNLTGKWRPANMLPFSPDYTTTSPVAVNWVPKIESQATASVGPTISLILGNIFFQSIREIEMSADGNITATFTPAVDFLKIMTDGIDKPNGIYSLLDAVTKTSDKNLTFWYTANDVLFLTPYIPNILDRILIDNGQDPDYNDAALPELEKMLIKKLASAGVDTDALVRELNKANSTGFPMIVKHSGQGLSLTLTKEMIAPLIDAIIPALPALDKKIAEMIAENPDNKTLALITGELFPSLNISCLTDLGKIWTDDTAGLTITLNLIPAR